MAHQTIRVSLAAWLLIAGVASAAPLPVELGTTSADTDRIFAHGGGVLVSRQDRLEYFDAQTLVAQTIEVASGGHLAPLPIGSRDQFYYALDNPSLRLMGLRGLEKTQLTSSVDLTAYASLGNHLLFLSANPADQEIWASDGSSAGTGRLMNVGSPGHVPCSWNCVPDPDFPRWIEVSASGRIYYMGIFTNIYWESFPFLWTRDPPAQFPGLPPAAAPEVRWIDTFGYLPTAHQVMPDGRLFFVHEEPGKAALFITEGHQLIDPIRFNELEGEEPLHELTELGGLLYFIVEKSGGRELWRSDGTRPGTVLVRAFGAGPRIAALWKHGGRLYLPVDAEGRGEELYVSDGTAAGTRLAFEIGPGPAGARPRSLTSLDDGRFLIALDDGVHGHEPWISDGTREGSRLLADARPGPLGSDPADLVLAAGRLFFSGATDGGRRTQTIAVAPTPPPCPSDRLCLRGDRFEVEATFTANGQSGKAQRSGSSSNDAGLFTFFSPGNWELMVKVLDGCSLNGRFWVFAAAATDVRFEIEVKDLESGQVKLYPFPGGPAAALADIEAFSTCPAN